MILIIYGGAKSMTDLRLNFTLTIILPFQISFAVGYGRRFDVVDIAHVPETKTYGGDK